MSWLGFGRFLASNLCCTVRCDPEDEIPRVSPPNNGLPKIRGCNDSAMVTKDVIAASVNVGYPALNLNGVGTALGRLLLSLEATSNVSPRSGVLQ